MRVIRHPLKGPPAGRVFTNLQRVVTLFPVSPAPDMRYECRNPQTGGERSLLRTDGLVPTTRLAARFNEKRVCH